MSNQRPACALHEGECLVGCRFGFRGPCLRREHVRAVLKEQRITRRDILIDDDVDVLDQAIARRLRPTEILTELENRGIDWFGRDRNNKKLRASRLAVELLEETRRSDSRLARPRYGYYRLRF